MMSLKILECRLQLIRSCMEGNNLYNTWNERSAGRRDVNGSNARSCDVDEMACNCQEALPQAQAQAGIPCVGTWVRCRCLWCYTTTCNLGLSLRCVTVC